MTPSSSLSEGGLLAHHSASLLHTSDSPGQSSQSARFLQQPCDSPDESASTESLPSSTVAPQPSGLPDESSHRARLAHMRRALGEAGSETTLTADGQATGHQSENSALQLQLASFSAQLAAAEEAVTFFRGLCLAESRARMLAVPLAKSALHAAADRQGQSANGQGQSAHGQGQSVNRHSQSDSSGNDHSSAADRVKSSVTTQRSPSADNVEASEADNVDSPDADSDCSPATVQSSVLATHSTADESTATAQMGTSADPQAKSDMIAAAAAAATPRQTHDTYRPLQSSAPAKSEGVASFPYPSKGDKTPRTDAETDMIQIPALHLQSSDLQRLQRELSTKNDTIQDQGRQITEHAVKSSGQKVLIQQLRATVQAWELPALLFNISMLPTKVKPCSSASSCAAPFAFACGAFQHQPAT